MRTARWIVAGIVAIVFAWFAFLCLAYSDPAKLATSNPTRTAMMILRVEEASTKGQRLRVEQDWVPLRSISPVLREAVRLSEDASFYDHDGFDFDEMEKAVSESMHRHRAMRGASTISQQLIKNVYLSPSRNPLRKVNEALLTLRLEQTVEKNRILELYLNIAEWGDGTFGVEAAARRHFGESAFALDPAHAVLLAAMLPMPLKVDPTKPSRWLKRRARRLLNDLQILQRISQEEYDEAIAELGGDKD